MYPLNKHLFKNEKILYQTHLHWIVFAPAVFWTVCTIMITLQPSFFSSLSWLSCILAIFYWGFSVIRYQFSKYMLTNSRVLIKTGFIRRYSLEIFLNKIEGIQVSQNLLGRLFGYGMIVVTGTGGTRSAFTAVNNPFCFRNKVQQHTEEMLLSD